MIKILKVYPSSPASGAGIKAGESIVSINGEPVIDEIDYQDLTQHAHLEIVLSDDMGHHRQVSVAKSSWESLGLQLDESVILKPRHCQNHCVFCFIDQMPPGMRSTLYVKDDDWRLSLIMGNYVTLTNVNDEEFMRILRRKASPLYISVHATDPDARIRMLRNPKAGNILQRLTELKKHGIQFHSQIVLCPGFNDGDILEQTISDLASLWPAALSVAVVPIGMTKYRDNLPRISAISPDMANSTLDYIFSKQMEYKKQFGTSFVFPSDEFFCLSGREIPPDEYYEDYAQLENGVGMIRKFEDECAEAFENLEPDDKYRFHTGETKHVIIPTGVSVFPHIRKMAELYSPPWQHIEVLPVENRYFGKTITVTGLIVGRDLIDSLKTRTFDKVLISESMLRENTDCFLDNITLSQVCQELGKPVEVIGNSGEAFINALYEMEGRL